MKRLLCSGYPDIYEICKVFRDGEIGRYHQPEFTMIEWYRLDFGLRDIIRDALDLISCLIDANRLREPPLCLSYAQALLRFAGVDSVTADIESLAEGVFANRDLRQALGERRDDWLNLVLAQKVAPSFPTDRLTVIHHYPASQAALARLCPDNPDVADRFEVFAGELELANGYVELLDAAEQRSRFEADQRSRQRAGRVQHPIDTAFLEGLRSGLPACAGVAVGFDRLHMFNEGADDIRRVLTFGFDGRGEDG
jgi:lysyl-tRNA synthetase class 2